MYVKRARLFLAIGLLFIPLGVLISVVQALVLGGFGLFGVDTTGESAGALALLVVAIGTTLTLLGLGVVQAATACALVGIDAGVPSARFTRTGARTKLRPLLGALAIAVAVWVVLAATTVLLSGCDLARSPLVLLAPVVELEGPLGPAGSAAAALVRGRWLRVASLVGIGALLAFAAVRCSVRS